MVLKTFTLQILYKKNFTLIIITIDSQYCHKAIPLTLVSQSVREVIQRKKLLTFGHCPKGGGGWVQPESKSFGVVFCCLLLGITEERGGGDEPIPKVLG